MFGKFAQMLLVRAGRIPSEAQSCSLIFWNEVKVDVLYDLVGNASVVLQNVVICGTDGLGYTDKHRTNIGHLFRR